MAERPSSLTFEEKELLARRAELQRADTIDSIDRVAARALALVERVRSLPETDAKKVGKKVRDVIDALEAIEAKYFSAPDEMKDDEIVEPVAMAEEDAPVADVETPQEVSIYDEGASHSEEIVQDWLDSQQPDYLSGDEVPVDDDITHVVDAEPTPSDENDIEGQIARELAGYAALEDTQGSPEASPEALVTEVDLDIAATMTSQPDIDTEPTVFEEQVISSEQNEISNQSNLSENGRTWLEKFAGSDWDKVLGVPADADTETIARAIPLLGRINKPNTPEMVISMFQGQLEGVAHAEIGARIGKKAGAVGEMLSRHANGLKAHYKVTLEDAIPSEVEDSTPEDQEKDEYDPLFDILVEAGYSEDFAEALLQRASADRGEYLGYSTATDRALRMLQLEFLRQQGLSHHEEVNKAMKAFFLPYANASNLDAIAIALGEGRTAKDASELILKGINLLYPEQAKEEAA